MGPGIERGSAVDTRLPAPPWWLVGLTLFALLGFFTTVSVHVSDVRKKIAEHPQEIQQQKLNQEQREQGMKQFFLLVRSKRIPVPVRIALCDAAEVDPEVAAAVNGDMGRCLLALYRSAKQPVMRNWGRDLEKAAARPGLAVIAERDKYVGGEVLGRRSAERAGARVAFLPGCGHWWMCENPALGAQVLDEFFASLS